ncbi:MAG: 2-C-methyl-D-erythritol 2,4-cyclodiphosphate synthase [Dehalococcoidia bacterium]
MLAQLGLECRVVEGDVENHENHAPGGSRRRAAFLRGGTGMMRIGQGEDLHRVDDGRSLVLGGVIIEEGPGLAGHSDADVLLHAITDAALGAAALGDIGKYFPPGDPRYAHADGTGFLRVALRLPRRPGWKS